MHVRENKGKQCGQRIAADGKCQDILGSLGPRVTDAQRAQPFTYDGICPGILTVFVVVGPCAE